MTPEEKLPDKMLLEKKTSREVEKTRRERDAICEDVIEGDLKEYCRSGGKRQKQ